MKTETLELIAKIEAGEESAQMNLYAACSEQERVEKRIEKAIERKMSAEKIESIRVELAQCQAIAKACNDKIAANLVR